MLSFFHPWMDPQGSICKRKGIGGDQDKSIAKKLVLQFKGTCMLFVKGGSNMELKKKKLGIYRAQKRNSVSGANAMH